MVRVNVLDTVVGAALGGDDRRRAMFVILGAAALVSLISTVVYRLFVDPDEMRRSKAELERLQKALQAHQKANDPKRMSETFSRITSTQMEMMNRSMKPTFLSMVPVLLILGWVQSYVARLQLTTIVVIPFPFFYDRLGWLGWYVMSSIAVSFPLRKLLGVEM